MYYDTGPRPSSKSAPPTTPPPFANEDLKFYMFEIKNAINAGSEQGHRRYKEADSVINSVASLLNQFLVFSCQIFSDS